MKKFGVSVLFLFAFILGAKASHWRAGEITYTCLGGMNYEIKVTLYSLFDSPTDTDNCQIVVHFGDGDTAIVSRSNGLAITSCPSGGGQMMNAYGFPTTKENIYITQHQYTGSGNFRIWIDEDARHPDIDNLETTTSPSSEIYSLYVYADIVVNPLLGCNNSPQFGNRPLDNACVGSCFEHSPAAFDPDGKDSLYYELSTVYSGGAPIGVWSFPPNMNYESIDHNNGIITWCTPTMIASYNIGIVVKEYRKLPGTTIWYPISTVFRDMHIIVGSCANNPPDIAPVNDTCVVAGTNLNFNVYAADAESSGLTLSAIGAPFAPTFTPPATFTTSSTPTTATGNFNWNPGCNAIQIAPYSITFKAIDGDATTPLTNYESVFIRVIAPPVTGLTASPSGSGINVDWNPAICGATGSNPLVKYYIYRKNSCDPFIPGPCETGVPSYTGYVYIGSTSATDTDFYDNNGGLGLAHGTDYSYIVVAVYFDGSQSLASANVCAKLVRDIPIITNVTVMTTDALTGTIRTRWLKPLASPVDLDTIANPPPYEYRLLHANGSGSSTGAFSMISSYIFPSYWQMGDTGYVSTLNTTVPHTYKLEFYSGGNLIGTTSSASSVFLSSTPGDKKVNLSWTAFVPWNNYKYYIHRETSPGSGIFVQIDSTTSLSFTDSNLVNEVQYCYRVLSRGEYSDATLPRPLYNLSQVRCDIPVDLVPPCQPQFNVVTDCSELQNVITWVDPNTYCCDDAVQINIYYSATVNDPLQIIYSTMDPSTGSYTLPVHFYENVLSIAGCYAVTAVDSALNPNESPIVNKICIDNCPEYELPNVFTPNNDGKNDLYTPLPGYRHIRDIDMKIYDRWGLLVFATKDKDILWDGKRTDSGKSGSDGVYFYTCIVNEIRVSGIRQRELKGFIHLIHEGRNPDPN